jgi:hypothetical protein
MAKKKTINIDGTEIAILAQAKTDYISLTDMSKCDKCNSITCKRKNQ